MSFKLKSAFRMMLAGLLTPLALLHSAWVQPPVTVNDPAFIVDQSGGQPVMIVTPQGNALAIWYQFTPGDSPEQGTINSSFYLRGFGWQPPQTVSSLELSPFPPGFLYVTQGDPDIGMNSSNYAVAVWQGSFADEPFPFPVIASVRDPNTGIWSPVEIISDVDTFQSINPNVAVNEPGKALAAWRDAIFDDGFFNQTTISFLPLGGSWSPRVSFSPEGNTADTRDNKPYPVINNTGDAAVSWWFKNLEDFDIEGVKVATYKNSTGLWTETTLETEETRFGDDPRCAIGPTGNIVVIWQKEDLIQTAYFNGTSWEPTITLGNNGFEPPSPLNNASIVMDPQGNITAVWSTQNFEVFAAQRPANGTWGTPQVINGPPDFARFHAFMSCEPLSVNPEGDLIAIWKQGNAIDNQTLWAAVKLFGQDWRAPEQVQLAPSPFGFIVQNAGIASCGFAIALWQERLSSFENVTRVRATITENLLVPLNAMRTVCCEKFATHTRCINILTWTPDPCVLFFNIFRDGVLIAQVPGNLPPRFFDPVGACIQNAVYEMSTINLFGFEGDRVPVVLN